MPSLFEKACLLPKTLKRKKKGGEEGEEIVSLNNKIIKSNNY